MVDTRLLMDLIKIQIIFMAGQSKEMAIKRIK